MPTNSSSDATDARSTIERILDGSRIVDAGQRVSTTVRCRLAATTARLTRIVQGSFLYGWLTAEPDPDVIVIDLRETWTVGPFIRVLDRSIETVAPWYRQSTLKRGVDAVAAVAERVADTRPGRVLISLFEPPDPPADDQRHRDDRDDRDDE